MKSWLKCPFHECRGLVVPAGWRRERWWNDCGRRTLVCLRRQSFSVAVPHADRRAPGPETAWRHTQWRQHRQLQHAGKRLQCVPAGHRLSHDVRSPADAWTIQLRIRLQTLATVQRRTTTCCSAPSSTVPDRPYDLYCVGPNVKPYSFTKIPCSLTYSIV